MNPIQETELTTYKIYEESKYENDQYDLNDEQLRYAFPRRRFTRKYCGHDDRITALAVYTSSLCEEAYIVSGSADRNIIVWKFTTGEKLVELTKAHSQAIRCLDITPTHARHLNNFPILVSGSEDKQIVVWELPSGKLLRKLQLHDGWVVDMKIYCPHNIYDKNSQLVVSVGYDRTIAVWNLLSGEVISFLEGAHDFSISCMTLYIPSKKAQSKIETPLIITAAYDDKKEQVVKVWDCFNPHGIKRASLVIEQAQTVCMSAFATCEPEPNPFYQSGINYDLTNPILIGAGYDFTIYLWDLCSGILLESYSGLHTNLITSLSVYMKAHYQWNVWDSHDENDIQSRLVIRPNVVSTSYDKTIVIIDVLSGEPVRLLDGIHTSSIICAKITKEMTNPIADDYDTHPIIATGCVDGIIGLWDLGSVQSVQHELDHGYPNISGNWLSLVAICEPNILTIKKYNTTSPLIITVNFDNSLSIWDFYSLNKLNQIHTTHPSDQQIRDLQTLSFPLDTSSIDNNLEPIVLTRTLKSIVINSIITGDVICSLRNSLISDMNTMSTFIYETNNNDNNKNKNMLKSYHDCDLNLAYYGALLFYGLEDGSIISCDVLNNFEIIRIYYQLHNDWITTIAGYYSLEKNMIVQISGSRDKNIIIIDISSGNELRRISNGHEDRIKYVGMYNCLHDNNKTNMVSISYDNAINITDLYSGESIMKVKDILPGKYLLNFYIFQLKPKKTLSHDHNHKNNFKVAQLIMGSFDGIISILDLLTYEIIYTVQGSNGFMKSMAIYHVPSDEGDNLFILASGKESYITIIDTLYPFKCTPPSNYIKEKYKIDLIESNNQLSQNLSENKFQIKSISTVVNTNNQLWKNMTHILNKFGFRFFVENSFLFLLSILHNKYDFLSKFQKVLEIAVGFLGKINGKNVLDYAIQNCDTNIVHILLTCFIENLNNNNILFALHPRLKIRPIADQLTKNILIDLAYKHPTEFHYFICSIKMIKSPEIVSNNFKMYDFEGKTRSLICGCYSGEFENLWERLFLETKMENNNNNKFDKNNNDNKEIKNIEIGQAVECFYIPLAHIASFELICCYIHVSNQLENKKIFESPIGIYVNLIFAITKDIKYFIVILSVALCGFAQAFWILSFPNQSLPFGTVGSSLYNSFLSMLGQIQSDFDGTASPPLATLFMVLFLMIIVIIMLNLLISLMGDTFSRLIIQRYVTFRYDQACTIIEEKFVINDYDLQIPTYVHISKYALDLYNDTNNIDNIANNGNDGDDADENTSNHNNKNMELLKKINEQQKLENRMLINKIDGMEKKVIKLEKVFDDQMKSLNNKIDLLLSGNKN
eukprot:gene11281-15133_t